MEIAGFVVPIIIAILVALFCNRMAKSQGRHVIFWTALGFVTWIAIIVLYFRGDSDEVSIRKAEEASRRR